MPIQFPAELTAFGLAGRGVGKKLEGLPLSLGFDAGSEQAEKRGTPSSTAGAADQTNQKIEFIPTCAVLGRQGEDHVALEELNRITPPVEPREHDRVIPSRLIGPLGEADGERGDPDAARVKDLQRVDEPLPLRAQEL